jgi:hypothetical protein
VVIRCTGARVPDEAVVRGRCTVSGAISDNGRFVERLPKRGPIPNVGGCCIRGRAFVGAQGTMWFKTLRTGYWWILKGTKAYAGIRGHGRESRDAHGSPRVDITMRGTVSSKRAKARSSRPLSGANAGGRLQGRVRINLTYTRTIGREMVARGRFTVSGAISDRGRFVERWARVPARGPNPGFDRRVVRALVGAQGSIWTRTFGTMTVGAPWEVMTGTNAYTGLRGRGRETSHVGHSGSDITMAGTVSKPGFGAGEGG